MGLVLMLAAMLCLLAICCDATMKAAKTKIRKTTKSRQKRSRRGKRLMEDPPSVNSAMVDLLKESDTASCTEHTSRRRMPMKAARRNTHNSNRRRARKKRRGKRLMEDPPSVNSATFDLLEESDTASCTEHTSRRRMPMKAARNT